MSNSKEMGKKKIHDVCIHKTAYYIAFKNNVGEECSMT